MSTPEGAVKKIIVELLRKYNVVPASRSGVNSKCDGWYYFAVQGMLSVKGVPDIVGHYRGLFFAVEAKAPGKKPTGFQALQIAAIKQSGGFVCVVDGPESLKIFEEWLEGL